MVGHTRQPRGKRLEQHAKGKLTADLNLKEICEVRGKPADESFVKRYFSEFAWNGKTEVFSPFPEVYEYVRWLRDQHFVSVPELSDEERDALPIVDSGHWLPRSERRKRHPLESSSMPGLLFDWHDFPPREITGDDFYTNELIIDAAKRVLGGIDLDPASHAMANKVVCASRFFTIADDGLRQEWAGRVWLNPPFSAWAQWVPKVINEWRSGRIPQMCVLAAMRTLTAQYFNPLLRECDCICIIRGRIKFWGGVAGDSPDDGHAVFYFGQHRDSFAKSFGDLGAVFYTP